jgi:hypothetical protein
VEVFVSSAASAPPSGTVALYVDGSLLSTQLLVPSGRNDASVEVPVGPLTPGSHLVTAVYMGSPTHSGSSAEIELRIK